LSDFSDGMVNEVKEKYQGYKNVTFEQINIEEIPYPEASFDVVIANMMLYHVPYLEKALSEAVRVLKPGGTFYAATVGENGIYQYLEAAINDSGFCWNQTQSFTLQNGESRLREYFNKVEMRERIDGLKVTDTNDLLNYIYSMKDIMQVEDQDRQRLYKIFENKKDSKGIIRIPKECGMFVAIK
jgi:ubiquinone/menaquinone biosynthesis C-methylase UbiE